MSNNLLENDDLLYKMLNTAIEGGNKAMGMKHKVKPQMKDNNSVVTKADKEVENLIRSKLDKHYSYNIIGEEHGGEFSGTHWVIDPIDGTSNYSRKQPLYGCSIALVDDEGPNRGVFYMPELDYIFYSKR